MDRYGNNITENCTYGNVYQLSNSKEYNLKILQINIQSLISKLDKFKQFLSNLNKMNSVPDIILMCETFLTDSNEKFVNIPGYNLITNNRKNKKGGGVAILIKKILISQFVKN